MSENKEQFVRVPVEVVEFLRGVTELDGLWFGDAKEGKKFWWREYLWNLATQPQAQPASAAQERDTLPEDLVAAGALRQFRHNNGSPGFVYAYDKDITDRFIGHIVSQRIYAALKEARETDAALTTAQPAQKPEGKAEHPECGTGCDCLAQCGDVYAHQAEQQGEPVETRTVREHIISAWCAGYYHAGYTHDSAYSEHHAGEYADVVLVMYPPAPQQLTDEEILEIVQADEFEDGQAPRYYYSESGIIAVARSLLAAREGGK